MKDQPHIRPPRWPKSRPLVDLHDPALNPQGRVDVLVARSLKLIVERNPDPVLKLMYRQFQPVIDQGIHEMLHTRKIQNTLRQIGLLPVRKPSYRTARAGRRYKGGL